MARNRGETKPKPESVNWNFRPNTQDEWIYNEVYVSNCYRLPDNMSGKVVIDVGANIGAFAVACLDRGARQVVCFEPDLDCRANLILNLRSYDEDRWSVINNAVVGEFRTPPLYLSPVIEKYGIAMTGGRFIDSCGPGSEIYFTSLKSALSKLGVSGNFWLKLDCEGSEHEILANNLPWGRIEQIFGEIHDCGAGANSESLRKRLVSVGYKVEIVPNPEDPILALFFASRETCAYCNKPALCVSGNVNALVCEDHFLITNGQNSVLGEAT